MRGNTKRVALCGIFSALALALMFLGGVVEVFDLTTAAFASFLVYIIAYVYGIKWGVSLYLVITILSFVFFSGKTVFFVFLFVGYYPLVKRFCDYKISNKKFTWIIKLVVFNIAYTFLLIVGKELFFELDTEGKFKIVELILAYPFGNLFIILYDIACTRLVFKYRRFLFHLIK
jgi:hypothetical protein